MAKSAGASRRDQDNKIHPGIKITLIVVAILCVATLVYAICDATGIVDRNATAMTVGDEKISVMEFNQYYHAIRGSFLNQNGSYLSMYGYDISSPAFDAQICIFDSNKTWKEYFADQAKNTVEQFSILYQEAQKAGYTMSEEDQKQYDSYFSTLSSAADEAGMSESAYVRRLYGSGTRMSDVEAYYNKRCLATGYYQTILDGFGIDDSQIDAYYQDHTDDYDVIRYALFDIPYTTYTYDADSTEENAPKSEAEAEQMTKEAKEAAKKDADALLLKMNKDGSNFDTEAAKYKGESEDTFQTAMAESVVSKITAGTVGDWLTDSNRKAGDLEVLDDEDSSNMSLILYLGRQLSDDYTVAVRHILFRTETAAADADEATKAEIESKNAEIKAQAESVYADWQAVGTEDDFASKAAEYSADGNASQGGIYTGVTEGQMVETFNDWCFDPSRKPGDSGIVETNYGYHLMYFVENEGPAYRSSIKSTLESEKFNEYLENMNPNYPITSSEFALSTLL